MGLHAVMSLAMFLLTFIGWFSFATATITVTPREATIYLGESVILRCAYPDDIEVEWFLQIGSQPVPIASNNDKACLKDKKTVEGKHAIHRQSDTVCVLEVLNLEQNVTYRCMSRSDSPQDRAVITVQKPPLKSYTNHTVWMVVAISITSIVVLFLLIVIVTCVALRCRKNEMICVPLIHMCELCCLLCELCALCELCELFKVYDMQETVESCNLPLDPGTDRSGRPQSHLGERQQLCAAEDTLEGISWSLGADNANSGSSKVKMDNSSSSSFNLRFALASNPGTSAGSLHSTGDLSAEQKMEIITQVENTSIFKQNRNEDILIETGNLIELLKELASDAIACKLTSGVKKFQDMEYYTGKLNIELICNVDEDVKSFNDGSQFQSKAKSRREYNATLQYERKNKIEAERKQKVSGRAVGVSESSVNAEYHIKLLVVDFLGNLSGNVLDDISYAERKAWDLKFQQDGTECQYHRQCYVIEKIKNFKELISEQWCRAHVEFLLSEDGKGCSCDGSVKDIKGFILQKEKYAEEIDEKAKRDLVRLNRGSCTCRDADLEANNAVGGIIEHRTGEATTATARNDRPLYRPPVYRIPDQAYVSVPQVGASGSAVEANSNLTSDTATLEEINNGYPLPVEDFEYYTHFIDLREDREIEFEDGSGDSMKISEEGLKAEPRRSSASTTRISGSGSLTTDIVLYVS